MAKDMAGNVLAEGDFVHMDVPIHVFGRIVKITHGGAIIGHQKVAGETVEVVSPGIITVEIVAQATFDPKQEVCTKIIKCYDPDKQKTDKLKLV